jgi:hypothetical protein
MPPGFMAANVRLTDKRGHDTAVVEDGRPVAILTPPDDTVACFLMNERAFVRITVNDSDPNEDTGNGLLLAPGAHGSFPFGPPRQIKFISADGRPGARVSVVWLAASKSAG